MNTSTKKCEYCGRLINSQALYCDNCSKPLRSITTYQSVPNPVHAAPRYSNQPAVGGQRMPTQGPLKTPKSKYSWWVAGLIGIVILCMCLGSIGVGVWYLKPDLFTLENTESQTLHSASVNILETIPANPGGIVTDRLGASLSMPNVSQPSGYQTSLVVSELGGTVGEELINIFGDGITFYSLTPGTVDGVGHMELSLPAPSPESRLAVLVDGTDLMIIPNSPIDGKLTAYPRLSGGTGMGETNLYTVLNAGDTALQNRPGIGNLASHVPGGEAQSTTGVSCSGRWSLNDCRSDSQSMVFVLYKKSDAPASMQSGMYPKIDTFIAKVVDIFSKYYDNGNKFTQANISSSRTVTINVSSSYAEPYYSPRSGNIYLNWAIVENIVNSGEYCTIAHEIMHWVEDEQYPMNSNYYSSVESWWLEMTAMYSAFFYSPDCIEATISTYGAQTIANKLRAYQAEPFTWASGEDARYLQGIQFYLGVCSGAGCAISQMDLINAINAGSYPYDGTKQTAYTSLAKDTGLYMLGEPPTQGNTSAPIPPSYTQSGTLFEYLVYDLANGAATPFLFPDNTGNLFTLLSPQKASVTAAIAIGGEYPLFIGNGEAVNGTTTPGIPAMVRIPTGTASWTKLNGQNAIFHDGTAEVLVGPVGKLGSTGLRILAVAPTVQAAFTATYEIADLSGDWGASHSNVSVISNECAEEVDTNEASEFLRDDFFLSTISGNGTYVLDPAKPDGTHYIWQGTSLSDSSSVTSDITVEGEKIVLKYSIHMPKPTAQNYPLLGTTLMGMIGFVGVKRQKRWNLLFAIMIILPLVLSGCDGFSLYGDINGTYSFTSLSYTDPITNPGTTFPWALDGTGEIDMAIEFIDDETQAESPCHTVLGTNVKAKIGPADSITPPDLGEE